ncbi:FIG003033: Helicase domain protein [Kitasatospora purpeofusca]
MEAACAERRFGHRHFMNLTAVFTAAPEFTVLSGHTEIGKTDPVLLTEEVTGPRRLQLAGEVVATKKSGVAYDHVQEVRDAQGGLLNRMHQIKVQMSKTGIDDPRFPGLQAEPSKARNLLDYFEKYLPRRRWQTLKKCLTRQNRES